MALRVKVTRSLEGVIELLDGARAELLAANAVASVVLLARMAAALLELTPLLRRLLSLTGARLIQLHAPAVGSRVASIANASQTHTRSSKTPDADSKCFCQSCKHISFLYSKMYECVG